MSHELLANLWYYILALVWAIYVSQELFVTGVGMLSLKYKVDSDEFKKINESVGTFWDGIQVWLIVAIGGLFACFPMAYALTLQALYIPFYLLLLAVIFRGTSIELIYKSDDVLWQKWVSKVWAISSFLLIFIEGVYLVNLFIGLPIKDGLMTDSFIKIFSKSTMMGGLLLVLSALTLGYTWIKLTLGKEFDIPSRHLSSLGGSHLWYSGFMIFATAVLYLALTNKYTIFENGLYAQKQILWAMPISAMLIMVLQFLLQLFKQYALAFVAAIIGIFLVLFSGFSASFPYILASTIDPSEGILILDAAASQKALTIITNVTIIFLPIVLGYQGWKYYKFWRKF